MGAFFTNYQVHGKSTSAVCKALGPLVETRAYVSPKKGEWVTVYDEASDDQNDETLKHIAGELSKKLQTSVFAFLVHDSDIAAYWLYQNGNLTDEFNSAPDYFAKVGEKAKSRVRGKAETLLPLCITGTSLAQVEEVIHPADGFAAFAEQIFDELAKLLGIDDGRMSLGFRYFDEEGEELLDDAPEFEPVGKGTNRKEGKPREESEAKPNQPSPINIDTFPVVIGMMTRCWTGEHEKMAEALNDRFPGQIVNVVDQMSEGADRVAQNFLKHSKVQDAPTFKELKAARDQGPEALAKLLIQRAPTQLGTIADGAIGTGLERFVAALLANGMDPNTPNQHGESLLTVAENCKKTAIYNLLKSAIEKKS
ncbi:MAG TPA: hypothetical protein VMF08_13405 [Candidatus Sulfotelmatobacter sp.]|nr:hypothetical protein [Candidatus Sulfotelmatobacter sp.]